MKRLLLSVFLAIMVFNVSPVAAADKVVILNYHDIGVAPDNALTATPERLREHFNYFKQNGYQPISLSQFIDASQGTARLPPKSVLLTFDDGYISFYREVYPLLKEYNYPAVLAVVTSWLEDGAPSDIGHIVGWEQIREMEASKLVTAVSHTHDLHRYLPFNPYGDQGQAAAVRLFNHGRYETESEYQDRVAADFNLSQALFTRELGHKAVALVWPYGEYTLSARRLGQQAGFEAFFTLDGGFNQVQPSTLQDARRVLMYGNPDTGQLAMILATGNVPKKPVRMVQVDLDFIYDATSPAETERNLDETIEKLRKAGINTVYLQAFNDSAGNGNIEKFYFYNYHVPIQADIFSHAAYRLRNAGFRVYAWMPSLTIQSLTYANADNAVIAFEAKGQGWYNRATPFSTETSNGLRAIYSDLAAYSPIDGIMFQDDLYLNDYEDFSPAAQATFANNFGQPMTPVALKDSSIKAGWTKLKTARLTELTQSLLEAVHQFRPQAKSARNIYAEVVMQPEAESWFAQNYSDMLNNYDYTVVMAYPYMEKQQRDAQAWLSDLAAVALKPTGAADKVVFKLQSYDWDNRRWLSERELERQTDTLVTAGAIHIGRYPLNIHR